MSYINPTHRGISYGDGYMAGPGKRGQAVFISGNDLFTVNTDCKEPSFGLLINDYKNGEMPGIYCGGGVYETDCFEGTPKAGDNLRVSTGGYLEKATRKDDFVVARTISAQGGVLKLRLLV